MTAKMIIIIKCIGNFNIKYILKFTGPEAIPDSAYLVSTFNQNITLDAYNYAKHHVWQLVYVHCTQ